MYRKNIMAASNLTSCDVVEGETIEMKIERIVSNKEPIKDGAPEIFTERAQGVVAAYNIRTDRWELATDAMDAVQRSIQAKRDAKAKGIDVSKKDAKLEKVEDSAKTQGGDSAAQDSGAKSIQGGNDAKAE